MAWGTTMRSHHAKKMASLVLSKLATRIDLPQGDHGKEGLRSLPEELSIIPFVRLGKQNIQLPDPEAFQVPFPRRVLLQAETT